MTEANVAHKTIFEQEWNPMKVSQVLGVILALDLEESGFYTHLASPSSTHAYFSLMLNVKGATNVWKWWYVGFSEGGILAEHWDDVVGIHVTFFRGRVYGMVLPLCLPVG